MYEKCNELDKSLNDILVVLTMDPHHLKARIRRGRILEAQVIFYTGDSDLSGYAASKCNRFCDRYSTRACEKFTTVQS